MAVVVPLQQYLTKRDLRLTEAFKDLQDKRLNAVTELVQAIRFVKCVRLPSHATAILSATKGHTAGSTASHPASSTSARKSCGAS
jgi:hypothetical protein